MQQTNSLRIAYLGNNQVLPYHQVLQRYYVISSLNTQYRELRLDKTIGPDQKHFYKEYQMRLRMLAASDRTIKLQGAKLKAGHKSFFLISEGNLWAYGSSQMDQLGVGQKKITLKIPMNLRVFVPDYRFLDVQSCQTHSLSITLDQKLLGWGQATQGALVGFKESSIRYPTQVNDQLFNDAKVIYNLQKKKDQDKGVFGFQEIKCQAYFSMYLFKEQLFTSGVQKSCRLGSGSDILQECQYIVPVPCPLHLSVIKMDCGIQFCIMLDNFGLLYGWGSNSLGQIAQPPTIKFSALPIKIDIFSQNYVTDVACGDNFSLVLTQDALFTWGSLLGAQTNDIRPKKILLQQNTKVSKIACGSSHAGFLTSQGRLYAWGYNYNNCIARSQVKIFKEPYSVTLPKEIVSYFSMGKNFTVFCYKSLQEPAQLRTSQVLLRAMQSLQAHRRFVSINGLSKQQERRSDRKSSKCLTKKQSITQKKGEENLNKIIKQHFHFNHQKLIQIQLAEMNRRIKDNQQNEKLKKKKIMEEMMSNRDYFASKNSSRKKWEHRNLT